MKAQVYLHEYSKACFTCDIMLIHYVRTVTGKVLTLILQQTQL